METFTALTRHALRLASAWLAMLIALYAALVGVGAAMGVVLSVTHPGDSGAAALLQLPFWLVVMAFFAIPLAGASAVLAIPLLMLQRFIVGPQRPYLRPGYLAVMLYGPALLRLAGGLTPDTWTTVIAAYEVVVLAATLIYVRLAEPFDLFPEPPRQAPQRPARTCPLALIRP